VQTFLLISNCSLPWHLDSQLGPKRLTILVGPEAQEVFFKANDDVLSQNEVYGFMKHVFGPGVVYDATRKNRQTQIQSVTAGLRVTTLKSYVAKVEKETRQYLKEYFVGQEGEIDIFHALSELTILTASRTLHGDDVREGMFKEICELYHDMDQGLTPLTVFWPNAPTPEHRRRDKARAEMIKIFSKVIADRRENPGKNDGDDLLSAFMKIVYKDGSKITDEQITGLLIALLFAGQHTSCISSTWTSLFIAHDTTIMKRIIDEQDKVLNGNRETPLTYDLLSDMQLLHDCMREALRLCPPLILLNRLAVVDIPVKSAGKAYVIPKGDMVAVAPSNAMRLPDVFKNPNSFDPDRYGPGREEHKIPYAYLGFGGGMHSCMGQNFAFMQVKTILSILFREFEIQLLSPKMPEINFQAMVVGPKGDCRVRYKRRKQVK
jgi:sterol 14-demethylase